MKTLSEHTHTQCVSRCHHFVHIPKSWLKASRKLIYFPAIRAFPYVQWIFTRVICNIMQNVLCPQLNLNILFALIVGMLPCFSKREVYEFECKRLILNNKIDRISINYNIRECTNLQITEKGTYFCIIGFCTTKMLPLDCIFPYYNYYGSRNFIIKFTTEKKSFFLSFLFFVSHYFLILNFKFIHYKS